MARHLMALLLVTACSEAEAPPRPPPVPAPTRPAIEAPDEPPPPSASWPSDVEGLRASVDAFTTVEACLASLQAETPTAVAVTVQGVQNPPQVSLAGTATMFAHTERGLVIDGRTNIATNALDYFLANVDQDTSPYGTEYLKRISILKGDPGSRRRKAGPETVYRALRHALTSARPRAHYPVTTKAKLGLLAQRLLPPDLLYKVLIRSQ